MEWWEVYLFTRLDDIIAALSCAFTISAFFLIAVLIVITACYFEEEKDDIKKSALKSSKPIGSLVIVLGFALVAIPNQKEMAAIYIIPKVTHNQQIQTILKTGGDLVEAKFKQWYEETLPANRGE